MCGAQFMIPLPAGMAAPSTMVPQPQPQQPFPGALPGPEANPFGAITSGPDFSHLASGAPTPEAPVGPPPEPAAPAEQPPAEPEAPPEPRIVRIPCEKCGQHLHTPDDMFGQRAMCPYCNHQFDLRYEISVEYQEEQAERRRRREAQINKFFLTWAIRAAIGVGLLLVSMIGYFIYISTQQ
jgi:hypothetical protein